MLFNFDCSQRFQARQDPLDRMVGKSSGQGFDIYPSFALLQLAQHFLAELISDGRVGSLENDSSLTLST